MKLLPSLLTAASVSLLSTAAHATTLASWDTWSDFATADSAVIFSADDALSGIVATVGIEGTSTVVRNASFGSNDGTYGTSMSGATTSAGGLMVRGRDDSYILTISLTNNTGSDYQLTGFYFDFAPRQNTTSSADGMNAFDLTYDGDSILQRTGLPYVIDRTTNAHSSYPGYDANLVGSSIILADTDTLTFTMTFSGGDNLDTSSVADNMLFSGTAVIPEPSSFALLSGCLALGAVMVRRRR